MGQIENAEDDLRNETALLIVDLYGGGLKRPGAESPAQRVLRAIEAWGFEELRTAAQWLQQVRDQEDWPLAPPVHLGDTIGKLMRDDLRDTPLRTLGEDTSVAQPAEQVNHPAHYGGADNPYEVIKVLRAWLTPEELRGFCKGNAIKYLARARLKGATQQDHGKAAWYVTFLADESNFQ